MKNDRKEQRTCTINIYENSVVCEKTSYISRMLQKLSLIRVNKTGINKQQT